MSHGNSMSYVSLFSGIEAATVAWRPLGWRAVAFSEVDKFCCQLLAERYPKIPNLGDVSAVDWTDYAGAVDVVVGGSPCQAFSIAGERKGLMDERGKLMFEYVRAVREIHPKWLLWENVPGVFSQSNGDAFEALQRELDELGYSLAWRTLDAQFFGVAQRRRRVFLVGNALVGRAAAVLFEPESLRWDFKTAREKREATAKEHRAGTSYAIRTANTSSNGWGISEELTHTLDCAGPEAVISLGSANSNASVGVDVAGTLMARRDSDGACVLHDGVVRRMTPVECERLQGFPDGYTEISGATDGARYKALGNSMAVPVMRWIGERMALVDEIGDAA